MGNDNAATATAHHADNGNPSQISFVRIGEIMIVGALCTAGSVWATQQVLGEKIQQIAKAQAEFQQDIKQELRRIRDDFYVPRYMRQPGE